MLFAIPLVVILGGVAMLHVYWAMGGKWGIAYAVPEFRGGRAFKPSQMATWAVAGLLGVAVVLVMGKAGWMGRMPLPGLFAVGVWGLSFVFALRACGDRRLVGFFKRVKGTPFARWDTWCYSPLCLLLAILAAGLARLP